MDQQFRWHKPDVWHFLQNGRGLDVFYLRQMGASCVPVCSYSTNTKGPESWGAAGDSKLLYRWIIGVVSPLLARARLLCLWLFVPAPHSSLEWNGEFLSNIFTCLNEWINVSPCRTEWALRAADDWARLQRWSSRPCEERSKNMVNFEANKRWSLEFSVNTGNAVHLTYDLRSSKSL
jgi:hypothetical protein